MPARRCFPKENRTSSNGTDNGPDGESGRRGSTSVIVVKASKGQLGPTMPRQRLAWATHARRAPDWESGQHPVTESVPEFADGAGRHKPTSRCVESIAPTFPPACTPNPSARQDRP
jgi:hypothetical protein